MTSLEITEENFESEVLKSDIPVLIDFWAEWCGPCKILSPTVEELASDYEGKLKVAKVNVDDQGNLAMRYNVSSIPNLKFLENGNIVGELVGAAPKSTIEAEIKKHV